MTQDQQAEMDRWEVTVADPQATPQLLEAVVEAIRVLELDPDPGFTEPCGRLIAAIAAHPNTPLEHLLLVLNRYPRAAYPFFCRNPILPLLPLARPDFVEVIRPETAYSILGRMELTEPFAHLLSFHPDPMVAWMAQTSVAVAGKRAASRNLYRDLEQDLVARLRRLPEQSAHWERMLLAELVEIGLCPTDAVITGEDLRDPDDARRREKARNVPCPSYQIRPGRYDRVERAYRRPVLSPPAGDISRDALILSPDTPAQALELLVEDPIRRRWIRAHPNATDVVRESARAAAIRQALAPVGRECTGTAYFARMAITFFVLSRLSALPALPCDVIYPSPGRGCGFLVPFGGAFELPSGFRYGYFPAATCGVVRHLRPYRPRDLWLLLRLGADNNSYLRAAVCSRWKYGWIPGRRK